MELPRIVPEEGMLLCGKFVPGGTSVGCSPYIVHRQKEAYGEDAEDFRPERWIEADRAEKEGGDGGETRRRLERYYFTFGGSTTSCIVSPAAADCFERTSLASSEMFFAESATSGQEHLAHGGQQVGPRAVARIQL
jgi:hypothetical protein